MLNINVSDCYFSAKDKSGFKKILKEVDTSIISLEYGFC
jgi:hypothetical protein